jgi:hypothetical protein
MQHFVLISPHHCVHQLRYNLFLCWSNLDLPKSKLDQSSLSCCIMFGCIGCHLFTLRSTDWFASARITSVSVISIQRDWINQLFDLWFHPLHSRIIKHKVIWCIDHLLRSQMREMMRELQRLPNSRRCADSDVLCRRDFFSDIHSGQRPSDVNASEVLLLSLIFREMLPLRHSSFT